MKAVARLFFFACLMLTRQAFATDPSVNPICSGDARLDSLQGHWADTRLVNALKNGYSWTEALQKVNSYSQAFWIKERHILFVLNWHEGDSYEDKKCLIQTSHKSLRCLEGCIEKEQKAGEYIQLTRNNPYEKLFFGNRCYLSNLHERWCFSPMHLSIDGRTSTYKLRLDTSELPDYGTAISADNLNILPKNEMLPFLPVFVRTSKGFNIYNEDWASTEGYQRADQNKPWRKLVRIK